MKKILSILGAIGLIEISASSLVACGYRIKQNEVKDLSEIIPFKSNLGILKTSGANIPTEQQIKDKLKELYPSIDINKINILNITLTSAQIKSNDLNFYTGNSNVNYTISIKSLNWE
ncbi:lipoprotein [Spiroplasma endosymbiont of Dromius quadrimaculatus]|uniref:lipoprotein n=1 Tax=Spiroplasma endosymbiont of Dromius quadrimaculatus TaxID=3066283 RepID=UPI00313DC1B1